MCDNCANLKNRIRCDARVTFAKYLYLLIGKKAVESYPTLDPVIGLSIPRE